MQGAVHQSPIEERTLAPDACRTQSLHQLPFTGDIFNKVTSFGELYKAAHQCFRGVRWKPSVQQFQHSILPRITKLQQELLDGSYKISPYTIFKVYEPKQRQIVSTRLRDRIVQRSMCNNDLYQQLTKGFIYDNCACIKGKGTQFALKRLSKHMVQHYRKHGNEGWILKLDIKKFFPSVPH